MTKKNNTKKRSNDIKNNTKTKAETINKLELNNEISVDHFKRIIEKNYLSNLTNKDAINFIQQEYSKIFNQTDKSFNIFSEYVNKNFSNVKCFVIFPKNNISDNSVTNILTKDFSTKWILSNYSVKLITNKLDKKVIKDLEFKFTKSWIKYVYNKLKLKNENLAIAYKSDFVLNKDKIMNGFSKQETNKINACIKG